MPPGCKSGAGQRLLPHRATAGRSFRWGSTWWLYSAQASTVGRVLGGSYSVTRKRCATPVPAMRRSLGTVEGLSETLLFRCNTAMLGATDRGIPQRPSIGSVGALPVPSHPQYDLAKRQMSGGVVTFALDCPEDVAKQRAFRCSTDD